MPLTLSGVTLQGVTITYGSTPPPPDVSPPPPAATEFWAEYIRNTFTDSGQSVKTLYNEIFNLNLDGDSYTTFHVLKQDYLGNALSSVSLDYSSFPNINYVDSMGMAIDSDENVYSLLLLSLDNGNNPYQVIVKTDTDGNVIWSIYITVATSDNIQPVAIDCSDDFLYLVSTNNTGAGNNPILTQLNISTGAIIWSKEIAFSDNRYNSDSTPHISVDADSNVMFSNQIAIDTPVTDYLIWAAIIDSTGAFVWQKDINHPYPLQEAFINSMDIDPNGNSYISMLLNSDSGPQLGVVLALDDTGEILWATQSTTEIGASGISYSDDGVYLTGVNYNYVNPYYAKSVPGSSMYVAKFDINDGSPVWNNSYYIPGSTATFDSTTIDSEPGYYALSGSFYSPVSGFYNTIIMRQREDGVTNDFTLDKDGFITLPNAIDFISSAFSSGGDSTATLVPFGLTSITNFTPSILPYTPDIGIIMTNDPPVTRVSPPPPSPTQYWAEYLLNRTPIHPGHGMKIGNLYNQVITCSQITFTMNTFLKQDSFGTPIVERHLTYVGSMTDVNNTIIPAIINDVDDNTYILTQTRRYNIGTGTDSSVIGINKLDTDATLEFSTHLEFPGNVTGNDLVYSSDNFLYACSTIDPFGTPRIVITKIGPDSTIYWNKELIQNPGAKQLTNPVITTDSTGNLVVAAKITILGSPNEYTFWIAKINTGGAFVWQKEFTEPLPSFDSNQLNGIQCDPAGFIYLSGVVRTGNFVVRINPTPAVNWSVVGPLIVDMKYVNGAIYSTGTVFNNSLNSLNIIKLNANNGSVLWSNTYTGDATTYDLSGFCIDVNDADSYCAVYGQYSNDNNGMILVLRQNTDGTTGDFELDENVFTVSANTVSFTPTTLTLAGGNSDTTFVDFTGFTFPSYILQVQTGFTPTTIGIESTNS
jgi:outer membrane protein assembly factor BamB